MPSGAFVELVGSVEDATAVAETTPRYRCYSIPNVPSMLQLFDRIVANDVRRRLFVPLLIHYVDGMKWLLLCSSPGLTLTASPIALFPRTLLRLTTLLLLLNRTLESVSMLALWTALLLSRRPNPTDSFATLVGIRLAMAMAK